MRPCTGEGPGAISSHDRSSCHHSSPREAPKRPGPGLPGRLFAGPLYSDEHARFSGDVPAHAPRLQCFKNMSMSTKTSTKVSILPVPGSTGSPETCGNSAATAWGHSRPGIASTATWSGTIRAQVDSLPQPSRSGRGGAGWQNRKFIKHYRLRSPKANSGQGPARPAKASSGAPSVSWLSRRSIATGSPPMPT